MRDPGLESQKAMSEDSLIPLHFPWGTEKLREGPLAQSGLSSRGRSYLRWLADRLRQDPDLRILMKLAILVSFPRDPFSRQVRSGDPTTENLILKSLLQTSEDRRRSSYPSTRPEGTS